jgi:hypothetical protein
LIRSASLQHTNTNTHANSNPKNKSIQNGTSSSKPVIKKPILDMSKATRLRPRTAPTNHTRATKKLDGTDTAADNNKSKGGTGHNSGIRRQPLKA